MKKLLLFVSTLFLSSYAFTATPVWKVNAQGNPEQSNSAPYHLFRDTSTNTTANLMYDDYKFTLSTGTTVQGNLVSTGNVTAVQFIGNGATIDGDITSTGTVTAPRLNGGVTSSSTGTFSTVSGGENNHAGGYGSVVAGGQANIASNVNSSVLGGLSNDATGYNSTVAGGIGNGAYGAYSTVIGGQANTSHGQYSLTAGHKATALHDGAFVWADSTDAYFESSAIKEFSVRAGGGVRLVTGSTTTYITDAGITLPGLVDGQDLSTLTTTYLNQSSATLVYGQFNATQTWTGSNTFSNSASTFTVYAGSISFVGPITVNGNLTSTGTVTASSMSVTGEITNKIGYVMSHATGSFSVSITSGTGWDSQAFCIGRADESPLTITRVYSETLTSDTTVQFRLEERAKGAGYASGTNIFTVTESSAMANGYTETSFANAGIAVNAGIYFVTDATASAGTPTPYVLNLTVYFKWDD